MAYAKIAYGEISIDTTGMNPPLLTGNIVSEGMSWIILITLSLLFPDKQKFDWELLKERIHVVEDTVRDLIGFDLGSHLLTECQPRLQVKMQVQAFSYDSSALVHERHLYVILNAIETTNGQVLRHRPTMRRSRALAT